MVSSRCLPRPSHRERDQEHASELGRGGDRAELVAEVGSDHPEAHLDAERGAQAGDSSYSARTWRGRKTSNRNGEPSRRWTKPSTGRMANSSLVEV
jgi:hypothetical protein